MTLMLKDKELLIALKIILMILVVIGSVWLVVSIQWVIKLFAFSLIIVYIIAPGVTFLEKNYRLAHGPAVVLTFVVFLLFCILTISLMLPAISEQYRELSVILPQYTIHIQTYIQELGDVVMHLGMGGLFNEALTVLLDATRIALDHLAEFGVHFFLGVIDFVLILFIVFYLLYDFDSVKEGLLSIIPTASQDYARRFLTAFDSSFSGFVRGLVLRGLAVGALIWIALLIVDMPHALLLAIIAGILNLILYIGPWIAAVPAVLLSFLPWTPSPLLIVAIYGGIQVLDGAIFSPLFFGRTVNLKPITVVAAMLVGGQLGGLLGVVAAVPVAGTIKKVIEILREDDQEEQKKDQKKRRQKLEVGADPRVCPDE